MNKIMHPIEPEELMAHLDGELSADREAVAVAHLNECEECRNLVTELRSISGALKAWQTQTPEIQVSQAIESQLNTRESRGAKAQKDRRSSWAVLRHPGRDLAWVGVLAAVVILVVGTVRFIGGNASSVFSTVSEDASVNQEHAASPSANPPQSMRVDRLQQSSKSEKAPAVVGGLASRHDSQSSEMYTYLKPEAGTGGGGGDGDALKQDRHTISTTPTAAGPMIIRTADLALITKDFDKARESVDAILRRHRGYIGELKIGGSSGSGRTLTGTLRVPADQLDATIADLKPLGRVESESQSGQDVTSQFVDLQARLSNARNTEQRLIDLLRNRTGKLSDVLEVEQELDRVRGEIEQMEAQRKSMANQVSFATVNVTISEDYKAQLQVVPPSTATRLSNAAVEGYRTVVDGVLNVVLLALSTGPSFLLWGLVLFFPARFAWKKLRHTVAQ